MGGGGQYYDVADFSNWKRKQGSAYNVPPRANFLAAVNHVRHLLDGKKINWAAMGGLAMLCLGSRREMPDIHIVYDDGEYTRLKSKLEGDSRVRLPNSMNPLFPSKILVSTGPKFRDAGCSDNADIEVDLVPPGSHGTPSNDIFRKNQVMLSLNVEGKAVNIKGLNILYLTKTTLNYCKSRDLVWDPRKDLLFLCRNYGNDIASLRGHLDVREIQERFLGTEYFMRISPEERKLCYNVLLGKEPPPAMSLSPAPVTKGRPQTTSQKSAPALRTPNNSRDGIHSAPAQNVSPPKSADMRGSHQSQQRGASPQRQQINGPQNPGYAANMSRHPILNEKAPSSTKAISAQQSMPALPRQLAGGVPVFAHAQSTAPPMPQMPKNPAQRSTPNELLPAFSPSQHLRPQEAPQNHQRNIPNQSMPQPLHMIHHPKPSPQGLVVMGPHGHPHMQPQVQGQQSQSTALNHAKNAGNGQSSFAFELDAAPAPTAPTLPVNPPNTFIAELPAETVNPSPSQLGEMVVSPPLPSREPLKNYQDSPVSPPVGPAVLASTTQTLLHTNAQLPLQPQPLFQGRQYQQQQTPQLSQQHPQTQNGHHLAVQAAPPTLRSHSDPLDSLPTSLAIGGPGKRRSPTNSISQSAAQQQQPPHHPKEYELLNPSLLPVNGGQTSQRVSMYKAYSVSASPPKNAAPIHSELYHPAPNLYGQNAPPPMQAPPPSPPETQDPPSKDSIPDVLRSGPEVRPLQIIPKHLLPNPLGANPPTPPMIQTKHDSHHSEKGYNLQVDSQLQNGHPVAPPQGYAMPQQQQQHQPPPPHHPHPPQQNGQYYPPEPINSISQLPSQRETYQNPYAQNYPPPAPQQQHEQEPYTPTTYDPSSPTRHQRTVSCDSHASSASRASHDSEKLAREYQADLPTYGNGYASANKRKEADVDAGGFDWMDDEETPTDARTMREREMDSDFRVGRSLERRFTNAESVYDFT